jgi:glycosyltransferase involved in cell wall biosynthesis
MVIKMDKPKVSIVMPVFNGEAFLKQALLSILDQTFKNFELIIVDDASTDKTISILKNFKDKRAKIIRNKENLGVSKSLNLGIKEAEGEYIARFDADDICKPDRLKKQVEFLDSHPEYVLVSSGAELINASGKIIGKEDYPSEDKQLRLNLYKRNSFVHPAAMYRKKAFEKVGGYRNIFNGAEDYDLWFRLMRLGKAFNFKEPLIQRRFFSGVITQKRHLKIELLALLVRIINLPVLNILGLDGLVGLFTFLIYRFWLTSLIFNGRQVPPEPDDSYFYLYYAKIFPDVNTFEGFRLSLFSAWINLISKGFNVDLEMAYQLNFYLGTLALFIVILYFLRKIEVNKYFRIILISILGLYTGSGSYHGFYWVVPSFYQLIFYFLLLSQILTFGKTNLIMILCLSFFFIFIHPSSILIVISFIFYLVLLLVINKNKFNNQIQKSLLVSLSCLLFYIIYFLLSLRLPQSFSPESPMSALQFFQNIFKGDLNLISWSVIYHEYFSYIFIDIVTLLGFLLGLGLCWYLKKNNLLILFIATTFLVILTSVIPYGYRSLGFLWPLTFLILGYSLCGFYYLLKKVQFFPKTLVFIVSAGIYFVLSVFNTVWISSVNVSNNYNWDRACFSKISSLESVNLKLIYPGNEALYAFGTYGAPIKEVLANSNLPKERQYLIIDTESKKNVENHLNSFAEFLTKNISRRNSYPIMENNSNYWTNIYERSKFTEATDLVLDCGHFKVKKGTVNEIH